MVPSRACIGSISVRRRVVEEDVPAALPLASSMHSVPLMHSAIMVIRVCDFGIRFGHSGFALGPPGVRFGPFGFTGSVSAVRGSAWALRGSVLAARSGLGGPIALFGSVWVACRQIKNKLVTDPNFMKLISDPVQK